MVLICFVVLRLGMIGNPLRLKLLSRRNRLDLYILYVLTCMSVLFGVGVDNRCAL